MSTLNSLKLVATKKPNHLSPIVIRRNKLSNKLWEQIQLANSHLNGVSFTATKLKSFRDQDTGLTKRIEVPKRIKPWWFNSEAGKMCLAIKYGSRIIELAKGKPSIEITNAKELVHALETIKVAVEAGELDTQIEAASLSLRSAFKG